MATRFKVFAFSKPSEDSTIASGRIARFIAETLGLPLVWDEQVTKTPEDTLIIVNGAFAFCKHLPALGLAVRYAKRIIWVQNDYTISPPKETSAGKSPFRAAFRLRAKDGKPPMEYWTTCLPLPPDASKASAYLNWNQLTYEPVDPKLRDGIRKKAGNTLLYYGAYRTGREEAFDRYFNAAHEDLHIVVSSTSSKFEGYQYAVRNGSLTLVEPFQRRGFYGTLAAYGMGLYIEDKRSHRFFHSPANRFYEMLGAGLPMVFQPEAAPMLKRAGVDVSSFVVTDPKQIGAMMRDRESIGRTQRGMWHKDYQGMLRKKLRAAFDTLRSMR